jgi:hypothetical protein
LPCIFFEVRAAIRIVPVGKNDSHLPLEIIVERFEVVLALGFHDDGFFVLILSDRGSDLPELAVIVLGDEVSLNLEPALSVNQGAIPSKGICSVLLCALLSHLVLAHGFVIAVAVLTGVSGQLEAVVVCLHDID